MRSRMLCRETVGVVWQCRDFRCRFPRAGAASSRQPRWDLPIPATPPPPAPARARGLTKRPATGSGSGGGGSDGGTNAPRGDGAASTGGNDTKGITNDGGELATSAAMERPGDGAGWTYTYDLDPYSESQPQGPAARGASLAALADNLTSVDDTNALQTALAAAIASEDFELAAAVRDRLRQLADGSLAAGRIDWAATGMVDWLADRAQRLGYRFPTEIQRRAASVLLAGADAVVASETGSGKTLSFLMPVLARLSYPPDIFMDEMKGPQALVVVPTLELGVQVALLAFRLLGGNVSTGRPGDPANMYTYFGPKGIKVRGVLNKEEVVMAKSSLTYLAQVHLVVATPAALMEAVREPVPAGQLLRHLKVLVVDEVDECFSAFSGDMDELMATAADPSGAGNESGVKPQVVFVGATQRQDVLRSAVAKGWLREPVNILVGREGAVPPALSHRYIVVPSGRRLAALARSLRADLVGADQDAAPARVMLFVNTPAEAAAVAEPLRTSLWSDHRMAVLVPPGTILGPEGGPPGAAAASPSPSTSDRSTPPSRGAISGTSAAEPRNTSPSAPAAGSSTGRSIDGGLGRRGSGRGRYGSSSSGDGSSSSGGGGSAGGSSSGGDAAAGAESASGWGTSPYGSTADAVEDMFAYNPIRALHSFRDNKSTLLLATGAAARGLDLPGVSHVYSLGPPPDATQYLHRAGRAGRIGSTSGGVVTTLVTPEELPALLEMGRQLGIRLVQEEEATGELLGALPRLWAPEEDEADEGGEGVPVGESGGLGAGGLAGGPKAPGRAASGQGEGELGDVDQLRKGLEDLFNLM